MFSKTIRIGTPIVLISIILLIAYNSYNKTQSSTTRTPITVIPTNASLIIQVNDVRRLSRSLQLSNIYNKLENIQQIQMITNNAIQLSNLFSDYQRIFKSNSIFISIHKVSPNKSAFLFSTNFSKEDTENKNVINLFTNNFKILKYDNQEIYFSDSLERYFSFKEDILFYSSSKMLITDAIRTSNENTDNLFVNPLFAECYSTINKSSDINLIINYNNLIGLTDIFTKKQVEKFYFSEWAATDIKLKEDVILASGLSAINNSVNNLTDIFNHQESQNLDILNILPENTTHLFAISFSDQQKIHEKKNKILQNQNKFWNWEKNKKIIEDSSNVDYNELLNETDKEAGIFNTSSNLFLEKTYTYFKTKESIRATSLLQAMITSSSNYKDYRINKIIDNNITANLFGEILKANNPFFTTINDYFIFGSTAESLEYIIDKYNSKNVMSNEKSFKRFKPYISNNANIFIYLNPARTVKALKETLINKEEFSYNEDSIIKLRAFSLQINNTKNGDLHNLCLFYDNKYKESIKEEWYYALDGDITMHPQLINNHYTNEEMILFQDKLNKLIALNSSGEKLWEKQIEEKILGEINFIDSYNNNKFQALFNTRNQLYLLDRNGKLVNGFPKNLPKNTSMGHSLFDYDNNKQYRIMIVGHDNMIYNLNKKGEKVNGWRYKQTSKNINIPPKHFVVNENDYILNGTSNNTTKLLARNGSDRVIFKDSQSFISKVNISKEGNLYAITNENKLWIANTNGDTEIIELKDLNNETNILAYKNGYYIANKNTVSYINNIEDETLKLVLDGPIKKLTLVKEYLAITTENSLYLIKDKKIIDGFPIDSDGLFNISDINNNGKTNIINIRNGFIYNYEITD